MQMSYKATTERVVQFMFPSITKMTSSLEMTCSPSCDFIAQLVMQRCTGIWEATDSNLVQG